MGYEMELGKWCVLLCFSTRIQNTRDKVIWPAWEPTIEIGNICQANLNINKLQRQCLLPGFLNGDAPFWQVFIMSSLNVKHYFIKITDKIYTNVYIIEDKL